MVDNLLEKDLGGGRAGRMTVRGGLTEFPNFDDEDQDILNMLGKAEEGEQKKVEERLESKDIQSQIDKDHKVEHKRVVQSVALPEIVSK
jgi:hypothetical protein